MTNTESTFGGWVVSVAVYREDDERFQVYTRPYTIATYERADAERYAYSETAKDYPPTAGWEIIVSTMPLWWLPVQEIPC